MGWKKTLRLLGATVAGAGVMVALRLLRGEEVGAEDIVFGLLVAGAAAGAVIWAERRTR